VITHQVDASKGDHKYTVMFGLADAATCTCPDYEFRRHDCKHIKAKREELGMTTAVATIQVNPPTRALMTVDELNAADQMAARLIAARAVAIPKNLTHIKDVALPPETVQANVCAVIIAGAELGVKPMTSLRHMTIINGKTEPDGQLGAGISMAMESDLSFEITKETDEATTIRLRRPAKGISVEYTYQMADAKKAGLMSNTGWQKYPRDMRRWAALKRLCRAYCSDLINGIASTTMGNMPSAVAGEPAQAEYVEGSVNEPAAQVTAPVEAPVVPGADPDLYSPGDDPDIEPAEFTEVEEDGSGDAEVSNPDDHLDEGTDDEVAGWDDDHVVDDAMAAEAQRLLRLCANDWSRPDYKALYHELREKYMPEESKYDSRALTMGQAREVIADLSRRRGEPPTE
jgi:hypothetical protein